MIKKIGRLTANEKNELYIKTQEIIEQIKESPQKGKKEFSKLAASQNYFVRKQLGKMAAKSDIKDKFEKIANKYINSKKYAHRATALFFYDMYYKDKPEKMIEILSNYYNSIRWEAENLMDNYWKSYPKLMKKNMMKWIVSEDDEKRSLSFHGLENFTYHDPQFVLDFIKKVIDDDSLEVQKKITHTIIQIAKTKPAVVYPHLREWLTEADDKRIKTIWVSMKKLANSIKNSNGRDKKKNKDFFLLTKDTIKEWKRDKNDKVSTMGKKLYKIIKN